MKDTRTKHFNKVGSWGFTICAVAVAVIACIKGHFAYAVWPIIAAVFRYSADLFQTLSEDAIEYGDAMANANLEQSRELCDAYLKISELQEEINKLKK